MDLKLENKLISYDAEFAFKECKERAENRNLELDYVLEQFIKEFKKIASKNGFKL